MARAAVLVVLSLGVWAGCSGASAVADSAAHATGVDASSRQRADALARARIWAPVPVERMNIRTGPPGPGAFPFLATVACQHETTPLRGHSLKFACTLEGGDAIKVKVGNDNGEVFAEVATSRLLWALGFGADRMYPVRLICRGCPARFGGRRTASGEQRFDAAAIERPLEGAVFSGDDGWAWWELDHVDAARGGASLAERDALRLFAALVQHTDSKVEQQRLLCLDEPSTRHAGECRRPLLMLNDVGLTFGAANFLNDNGMGSANFKAWAAEPVWKDAAHCTANLRPSFSGTLGHPRIGEPGRRFLSDLLARLSDAQIADVFEVSRIAERRRTVAVPSASELPGTALVGGTPTPEWVRVFIEKRAAIAMARCS